MWSSLSCCSVTVGGRVGHEVDGLGGLWEGNHFAQAGRAGQQHDDAIEAEGDAAVRRRAVLERVEEEAEALAGFLFTDAERREDLLLHIFAMDADGAGAKFQAVHRQVVAVGADRGRIADEVGHVGFVGRGEGMMRGHPLAAGEIVLEHGEVDDPDGVECGGAIELCFHCFGSAVCDGFVGDAEGAVLVGILLGEFGAEVAGGGVDVDLALGEAAGELGVAGLDVVRGIAGDDDDEVGFGGAGELADLGRRTRGSLWRGA